MTDDRHGEGTPPGGSRWDPLPQGDYDDGATAFVKLPEGGIDALLAGDSPLAAPGHGYVPPRIAAAPPAEDQDGGWAPADGHQWADPDAAPPRHPADDRFTYRPDATQPWAYDETAAPAPGHEVTGQWSIPVAGGDLPDESGEFSPAALAEQWGTAPPATLPGGAPAPWATEGAGQPWGQLPPRHPEGAAHGYAPEAPPAEHPELVEPVTYPRPAGHGERAPYDEQGGPAGPGPRDERYEDAPDEPYDPEGPPEAAGTPLDGPEEPAGPETAAEGPEAAGEAPEDAPEDVPEAAGTEAEAPGSAGSAGSAGDAEAPPAAPVAEEPAPEPLPPHDDHPLASYVLRVNGTDRPVADAWIGESLLYVLRERLGLAGAKDGCSQGECGACNVQVDGRLVASCLVPAVTSAGSEVRTVEGLAADGQPSDVQRAFARCGAVQCGFCVPGMAMTVHDLLEGNPAPTELETRQALCGNLCRCSGYRGVLDAVREVVAEREARGADDDGEPRIPHQAGPGSGGVHHSAFDAPGVFDSPGTFAAPAPHDGPHEPHHGQDGGQA
ncbi:(2Fe-2S)-binding protein [Streptomyces sp. J2-1]|uniref:2Fe-2S iron-sulfur cluster-binding protein n=1 Tax=Streptomyces corallincola TaxID=2851888 RepID=UPI001C37EAFF|nr:2Fe-2S iron-sulfur cluster-binding protein [Streptomyces corallincola]MBV2354367.1 (2Fe-2S)-binding protein [Streptomyces corallincola]